MFPGLWLFLGQHDSRAFFVEARTPQPYLLFVVTSELGATTLGSFSLTSCGSPALSEALATGKCIPRCFLGF